jgi:ankyrin repeat protein
MQQEGMFSDALSIFQAAITNNTEAISKIAANYTDTYKLVNTPHYHARNTPLHIATKNGHNETVRLLIDLGSRIDELNRYDESPLYLAAIYGFPDTVRLLVNLGSKAINLPAYTMHPNGRKTPLIASIARNRLTVVQTLLDLKCNTYFPPFCSTNLSPLHLAAHIGSYDILDLLLHQTICSSVDPVNDEGFTPLHIAIKSGQIECIKLLIWYGASTDISIITPLEFSIRLNVVDTVKLMVSVGIYSKSDILDKKMYEQSEDDVWIDRYNCFFSRSLTSRLIQLATRQFVYCNRII